MNKNARLIPFVVWLALLPAMLRAQDVLDLGIAALRSGDYGRALDLLHQAEALHPNQADPHTYLGDAYMAMANQSALVSALLQNTDASSSIPEADRSAMAKSVVSIPETESLAEAELRRALALDPNNLLALRSIIDLIYHGHTERTGPEKTRRLAEAGVLYDRLTVAFADDSLRQLAETLDRERPQAAADPTGQLYGWVGDLIQSNWRQVLEQANHTGLESTGPLPNPMRQTLQTKYRAMINEGLADFQQALRFYPENDQAMIGMSNLIRDRAALRDTKGEYAADIALADAWMIRGFDTREEKTRPVSAGPPAQLSSPAGSRARIRAGENDQMKNLIQMVTPSYPQPAVQAHITGTVRFTVTIGRDGRPRDPQPISGNPILFEAARDALKQWVWKPTFVNGILVETATEVEVRFSPNQ